MNFKRFSILYLMLLGFAIVILFIFLHILSYFFEHNHYPRIVQYQIQNNAIYGSALNENYFRYRLELIKAQKPDIVAIGSSRVGQFKQKFFRASFVAAANGGNSLAETQYFLEEMLKRHKPKLVILGLDPWWFNKKMPNQKNSSYQTLNGKDLSASKIFQAIKIFCNHPLFFLKALYTKQTTSNPYTTLKSLGFRALIKSDGSFSDGSYLYFSTLSGIFPAEDQKFQNSKFRIENEIFPFYYGDNIDDVRMQTFFSILDFLKENQINAIILTTPLAPTIYNLLINDTKKRFTYLTAFDDFATKNHIYHFFNPHKLQTTDCEFYDGFHGGDVVYAKILYKVLENNPNIESILNLSQIKETIRTKSGYAYSGNFPNWKEVDFLKIGCKK